MIVAQIVETDYPGGTERLVIQIALELRRRGHVPVVFGPHDGIGQGWLRQELQGLGVVWDFLPRRWMLDPRAVLDIVRLLRRYRVDAVHSHEFAPSVFGAVASRVLRLPHVLTMHSNLYFAGAWRRRAAFRWAVRHSAAVAVARDTRDDVERMLSLPPGTIRVIPNGVAASPGRRAPVRTELGLGDEDVLVVALGNLNPRKAHILLLRAMAELGRRRPDLRWHVAIAGRDQGTGAELQQFAASGDIAARVHLLGHRADTEDVLAAADVFAMSSLHEGMPLAIMEAMFAAKPIVTSMAGGIAEMLTEGREGLLVPVGDSEHLSRALERVVADKGLRGTLGQAARARAERQFGIGPMMDAYMELYQRAGAPTRVPTRGVAGYPVA
jgi:glycosyltransferase involved in cell wall biosynthesis